MERGPRQGVVPAAERVRRSGDTNIARVRHIGMAPDVPPMRQTRRFNHRDRHRQRRLSDRLQWGYSTRCDAALRSGRLPGAVGRKIHQRRRGVYPPDNSSLCSDVFLQLLHSAFKAAFDAVGVEPRSSQVLLVTNPFTTRGDELRLAELLLGTFGVASFGLVWEPAATLQAFNAPSGIALHLGNSRSWSCPVLRGKPLLGAMIWVELGGQQLNERFSVMLEPSVSVTDF